MTNIRPFLLPFLLASAPAQAGVLDDANAAYNAGAYGSAISLYKKAIPLGESPALCYFNAANAYFQLDSLPQCVVYYRSCIAAAPGFFKAYLNLAVAYFTLNDNGNCIAVMRQGLTIEPGHQKALLVLGTAYRRTGAIPQAISTFQQLAEFSPDMEEPIIALAEMYRDLGDEMEAIRWLDAFPASGKSRDYALTLQAELFESLNNLPRSLYCLEQAFELDRSKKWLYYRIVTLHHAMGNDLLALEEAREGVRLFPDFADLALFAGNLLFERRRFDEASAYYVQAAKHGSAGAVVGLENIRRTTAAGAAP